MWEQLVYSLSLVWNWVSYEVSVHPVIFLGILIVIVSAWILYKAEVRTK